MLGVVLALAMGKKKDRDLNPFVTGPAKRKKKKKKKKVLLGARGVVGRYTDHLRTSDDSDIPSD